MRYRVLALSLLAPLSTATPAKAAGDAEAGRRLADTWCVGCHLVGNENKAPMLDVPPFPEIAKQRGAEDIRAFLAKPHPPMPQFRLTRGDVEDLVAFIGSLKK